MDLQKVTPGQRLRIPSGTWNKMIDAARDHERRTLHRGTGPSKDARDAGLVLIRNDSGGPIARFGVLAVGGVVIEPADNLDAFKSQWVLRGALPSAAGNIAIVAEPLANGAIGRACVFGVCPVRIHMVSSGDTCAGLAEGDPTQLASGPTGTARILYVEEGQGTRWGLVLLGAGASAAAATPIVAPVMMTTEYGQSAASADGLISEKLIKIPLPGSSHPSSYKTDWTDEIPVWVDNDEEHSVQVDDYVESAAGKNYLRWAPFSDLMVMRAQDLIIVPTAITVIADDTQSTSYWVRLNAQPPEGSVAVTILTNSEHVRLEADDLSQEDGVTYHLAFTDQNWDSPRQVKVFASQPGAVQLEHTCGWGSYQPSTVSVEAVEVPDPDTTTSPTIAPLSLSLDEEIGSAFLTVSMPRAIAGGKQVTVTIAPPDHVDVGEGIGQAKTLTFTPDSWGDEQTFDVFIEDDDVPMVSPRLVNLALVIASTDPSYTSGIVTIPVAVQEAEPVHYAWVKRVPFPHWLGKVKEQSHQDNICTVQVCTGNRSSSTPAVVAGREIENVLLRSNVDLGGKYVLVHRLNASRSDGFLWEAELRDELDKFLVCA